MSGDVEHPALATPEGMGDFSWRVSDEYRAILKSGVYLTPATHCARCIEAGHPEHYGSPRTCGFDASGAFKARNWSCATLDELRRIAYDSEHATRWNDISVAVMPLEYGFIVLHYHKDYGCTDLAYRSYDRELITLADAEEAIRCGAAFIDAYGGATP